MIEYYYVQYLILNNSTIKIEKKRNSSVIFSDVFELETLPDIMRNMTENLDNILIQLELRGINTGHSFDSDKISDDIVRDIEQLQGEYPDIDWIRKLYAHKMSKTTLP